ncbi:hypothetical protein N8Z70_00920 [Candidatus Puniceispirillum sp.]|nr:hypothetical protein [Alphaproteobacteria bacterium]MDC1293589.1 hypothetical protein [Candidatus Puniceispirillum sp.]
MTELQQTIETLIDQLLLRVTSPNFADFPLLSVLLANPNGRYVLVGLVIVISFIGLWILLRIVQILFGEQTKPDADLSGYSAKPEATNLSEALSEDGFQFFKRTGAEKVQSDDDKALAAIEQEMLAIKQLFADGHILKDVYVTETRRLYDKAKVLKT